MWLACYFQLVQLRRELLTFGQSREKKLHGQSRGALSALCFVLATNRKVLNLTVHIVQQSCKVSIVAKFGVKCSSEFVHQRALTYINQQQNLLKNVTHKIF